MLDGIWTLVNSENELVVVGSIEECLVIARYERYFKLAFDWTLKRITAAR